MIQTKEVQLTVDFKNNNVYFNAGGVKQTYNRDQALQLLNQDFLLLADDTAIMGFGGDEFKRVRDGIKDYYNIREWY